MKWTRLKKHALLLLLLPMLCCSIHNCIYSTTTTTMTTNKNGHSQYREKTNQNITQGYRHFSCLVARISARMKFSRCQYHVCVCVFVVDIFSASQYFLFIYFLLKFNFWSDISRWLDGWLISLSLYWFSFGVVYKE